MKRQEDLIKDYDVSLGTAREYKERLDASEVEAKALLRQNDVMKEKMAQQKAKIDALKAALEEEKQLKCVK